MNALLLESCKKMRPNSTQTLPEIIGLTPEFFLVTSLFDNIHSLHHHYL